MVWLIIALGLFFVFSALVVYFFLVAFVKRNTGDCDDVNDPCNAVLGEFKGTVGKSIERVKKMKHTAVETVSFDGLRLYGRYFPNNSDATIILFHGYRSSALRDMGCGVELYYSLGLNVLLVDQRAHGRSDGRLITFGVKESRDAASWAELVKERYNPKKIILGGMSMGATTVLLAAGEGLPENVSAIIADCGFTSPEEIIKSVAKRYFKISAAPFLPFINVLCRLLGGFSIKGASTERVLKSSSIPVLLIHGKGDSFVPCEMSERAFNACQCEKELLTVKAAGHGMSFLVDRDSVMSKIKEFLIKHHCLQSFH